MMEIVKVVKSQNVDLFTFENQTLTDNIFKYDLNLEKMNMDSCSKGRN